MKDSAKINKEEYYKLGFADKVKYTVQTKNAPESAPSFTCGICEDEINLYKKVQLFQCQHFYCEACVHQYVIYKVGIMEDVICPDVDCDKGLDT